jgi:hypothetical protein
MTETQLESPAQHVEGPSRLVRSHEAVNRSLFTVWLLLGILLMALLLWFGAATISAFGDLARTLESSTPSAPCNPDAQFCGGD